MRRASKTAWPWLPGASPRSVSFWNVLSLSLLQSRKSSAQSVCRSTSGSVQSSAPPNLGLLQGLELSPLLTAALATSARTPLLTRSSGLMSSATSIALSLRLLRPRSRLSVASGRVRYVRFAVRLVRLAGSSVRFAPGTSRQGTRMSTHARCPTSEVRVCTPRLRLRSL